MVKKKKVPRMVIWGSRWSKVARVVGGRERSTTLLLFTLAPTKKEAVAIMRDGIMGLPGVQGSSVEPDDVQRLSEGPSEFYKGFSCKLLEIGYEFILPRNRTFEVHQAIGEFVGRVVAQ